jgi:hypothetical protein
MRTHPRKLIALALPLALFFAALLPIANIFACGGFFCTTAPINQQVERIIFAQKGDTISAYVQINYTGPDADFAWVVPVPSVPEVDVAEMAMFDELDTMTSPVYIGPPVPECALQNLPVASVAEGAGGDVTVFSSGEVGPFGFDVVGSDDPQALVNWLRDNGYRIDPPMEPLVQVYVKEGMLFLAMKLRPGQGVQDIQPVKMTYTSSRPMIPLRLTAVAANPNMGVLVWLLGNTQYESDNYKKITITDDEIQFGPFGGSNYFFLRSQKIDEVDGRGFVTEFAGPTSELKAVDPDLQALLSDYPYLTRAYTEMDPAQMTVDPTFRYNDNLPPVSNVHDLSARADVYPCAAETQAASVAISVPPVVRTAVPDILPQAAPNSDQVLVPRTWIFVGLCSVGLLFAGIAAGVMIGRRSSK